MPGPEVSRAVAADRPRVVATVVAAFATDPAFLHFFPDEFATEAPAFVGHLFDRRVGRGTIWLAEGGAAVSLWDGPAAPAGGAPLEGVSAATRRRLDRYGAAVHDLMPTFPHWYLGVVATHPEHTGRRLGRSVIAAGLAEAEAAGLPAYLETSAARNVGLYESLGFAVRHELAVDGLPVWIMATVAP